MIWTLNGAMMRPSGDSMYFEYFLDMGFVFRNVVQIYDDYNVDHICKDVIHKSLKICWCMSEPFRHYQLL